MLCLFPRALSAALVAAALAACSSVAMAVPMSLIDPGLTGSTQFDGWHEGSLTTPSNPGYPGFPGSAAWPAPIGSSAAGSGDANLNKVANGTGGGPYPASGSIYFGGFSADVNNDGGTLSVTDTTPVAGLANIVFQIQIGEAWTFDFLDHVLPTLSYNGGSQALTADTSMLLEQFFNGTVSMPTGEENVYINTYMLQWDVSALGPITDFAIEFSGVQHAQLYMVQLDQSDTFSVVPEPGAMVLAGLGGVGLLLAARKRRHRQA